MSTEGCLALELGCPRAARRCRGRGGRLRRRSPSGRAEWKQPRCFVGLLLRGWDWQRRLCFCVGHRRGARKAVGTAAGLLTPRTGARVL
jgi:hypothetical protein